MNNSYLQHHGIKGMKWGVRRFQNLDGTRIKKTNNSNKIRTEEIKSTDHKVLDFVKKHRKTIFKTAMTAASIAGTAYVIKKSGIKVSDVPNLLKWSAKHPVKAASKVTGFESGYNFGMKMGEGIAKKLDKMVIKK